MKNFLEKILRFLKKDKSEVKLLTQEKFLNNDNKNNDCKNNFFIELNNQTINHKNNKIKTLVCVGDGLGITSEIHS